MTMILHLLLATALLQLQVSACPPNNSLVPCTCKAIGFHTSTVTCINVHNEIELKAPLHALRTTPIRSFEIADSTVEYLPANLFKHLSFERLFLSSVTMVALSDTLTAFVGLEGSLQQFLCVECHILGGWRWYQLRKLVNLRKLEVINCDLTIIDESIKRISHLEFKLLSFNTNAVSWIHNRAFADFLKLEVLSLKRNEIVDLKRSMLPGPGNSLVSIILGNNLIQDLPEDLFTDMPNLTTIYLDHNNIFTISENTFAPVWRNLRMIDLTEDEIRCDCRLKWLFSFKFPLNTRIKCSRPDLLKEKDIRTLSAQQLWC